MTEDRTASEIARLKTRVKRLERKLFNRGRDKDGQVLTMDPAIEVGQSQSVTGRTAILFLTPEEWSKLDILANISGWDLGKVVADAIRRALPSMAVNMKKAGSSSLEVEP